MKKIRREKSENGQILILLTLALVGILASVALALDGAMIYSDRRIAQNAADASSISGAQAVAEELLALGEDATYFNWDCDTLETQGVLSSGDVAAESHASIVDFNIDDNISDNNGVETECFDIFNGTYYETFVDVFVKIKNETPTSFLQLIAGDVIQNEVEVKTRVYPMTETGYGMTLISLYDPEYCDKGIGLEIKGGPRVDIDVGGIVSNSYLKISGTGSEDSGVWVNNNGPITYAYDGCYDENGSPTVEPDPRVGPKVIPEVDEPICVEDDTIPYPKKEGTPMTPGNYGDPKKSNVINFDLDMEPGLYCIDGDLTIHSDILNAANVTLKLKTGSLTINAGSSLTLTAPYLDDDGECTEGCGPAIPGLLIYMSEGNTGNIQINGNSDSSIAGTIYAPDGDVKINGNAQVDDEPGEVVSFGVQVIANTIYVGGTANMEFVYPSSGYPVGDIKLEVAK